MAGRKAKRFKTPAAAPVVFLGTDMSRIGDLVDVSISGLLLHTDQVFEIGAMRPMTISVGNETSQVVAVAKRRIPGVGTAFEFSHISPRDRELLRRFLLRLSGTGGANPSGTQAG